MCDRVLLALSIQLLCNLSSSDSLMKENAIEKFVHVEDHVRPPKITRILGKPLHNGRIPGLKEVEKPRIVEAMRRVVLHRKLSAHIVIQQRAIHKSGVLTIAATELVDLALKQPLPQFWIEPYVKRVPDSHFLGCLALSTLN